MKYNPCCEKVCADFGCDIKAKGGCYCVCRLFDILDDINLIKEGYTIGTLKGYIYYPDKEKVKEYLNNLPQKEKDIHIKFIEDSIQLERDIEEKIKKYELKDNEFA